MTSINYLVRILTVEILGLRDDMEIDPGEPLSLSLYFQTSA
jgi:hypothetical protein